MANPQGSPIWYELMTTDPDGASRFYGEVVGWNVAGNPAPQAGGMDYRQIIRSDGGSAGGLFALNPDMLAHGARPAWLGYLHVASVDTAVAAIEADGGRVMMPAMDLPVGRMAMVTDPQGAPFYVMTPVPPPGQPDAVSDVFSVDRPQHVRWNELQTEDPVAALGFYNRHFGWEAAGEMDMGEFGTYRFIKHGDTGVGAIMDRMPGVPVNMWTYYIGVDDIDRAVSAITANGGQVLHGPQEIPGGEFSVNGMDPQGATFGLVGPRRG